MDFASSFVDSDNLPEAIGSGNLGTSRTRKTQESSAHWERVGRVALTISTTKQPLNNSTMVLLNSKVYSPSAYVGNPRFTRMEKTVHTKLATGEDYPTMSQVGVVPFSSFGEKTELSLLVGGVGN